MIAYRAVLDVPTELVRYLARLLAAERRAIGTRTGARPLTCHFQAVLVLVWFRRGEDKTCSASSSACCGPPRTAAIMRPGGLLIWTSDVLLGHLRDLTCAQ